MPLEDLAVQPQPAAPNGETPWEAPARKRSAMQGSDKTNMSIVFFLLKHLPSGNLTVQPWQIGVGRLVSINNW